SRLGSTKLVRKIGPPHPSHPIMRWRSANHEEKHEPRGVSVAEALTGDSMKSSGRNLTLAAIEKRPFSFARVPVDRDQFRRNTHGSPSGLAIASRSRGCRHRAAIPPPESGGYSQSPLPAGRRTIPAYVQPDAASR